LSRDGRVALEEEGPASSGWAAPSEIVANAGADVDVEGAGTVTGVVPRLLVFLVVVAPAVVVVVASAASPSVFTISTVSVGFTVFD
jgi:hypothetical protein